VEGRREPQPPRRVLFDGEIGMMGVADAEEQIAAERIVEHLPQSRFVVMKKPAEVDGAALGRGKGKG
jgi:hypothetical protein